MLTEQMKVWSGDAGREYTNRHLHSLMEWEELYIKRFGISRTEMNLQFIGHLDRDIKILEVGCNVGNQLMVLQKIGFSNLWGIELQHYGVELARQRTHGINIVQGSAFDIPFKDGYFDMVFTSGVLIHFVEKDLPEVIKEIHRCSKKYIWGYEYYNEGFKMIPWRGEDNLMWASDYSSHYLRNCPSLSIVKQELYPYLNEPYEDAMFLLEK